MFSGSQAKKFVGKKSRIILPVTKFFTEDFFYRRNFMPTFFFRYHISNKQPFCLNLPLKKILFYQRGVSNWKFEENTVLKPQFCKPFPFIFTQL